MIYGISGAPCPASFPFAGEINGVANANPGCPPLLLAAIAWRETLCVLKPLDALTFVSSDGGRGVFQLTSSYPENWQDVSVSATFAWQEFLLPAIRYWHGLEGYQGSTLVLLVAATYNEGLMAAMKYHAEGNVDAGTTDEYGHGVLAIYEALRDTGYPYKPVV